MFEFEHLNGSGVETESLEDVRASIMSFMRRERFPEDFDMLSDEYLRRFRTHTMIFRSYLQHLDVLRADRHRRLLRQLEVLETVVCMRVPTAVMRNIVEDVRTNTRFAGLEGRDARP